MSVRAREEERERERDKKSTRERQREIARARAAHAGERARQQRANCSNLSLSFLQRKCTGWRRLIGSHKVQIIFHKRATKYRSPLRKMTYKDKGSYQSSPHCIPQTEGRSILNEWCLTYDWVASCRAAKDDRRGDCELAKNRGT